MVNASIDIDYLIGSFSRTWRWCFTAIKIKTVRSKNAQNGREESVEVVKLEDL